MFPLTKHERQVLIFLALVFLFGTILQYFFKKCPSCRQKLDFMDRKQLHLKIDSHKAAKD